jgi:hypothetical protein
MKREDPRHMGEGLGDLSGDPGSHTIIETHRQRRVIGTFSPRFKLTRGVR